jgi:hypothetical protein
MLLMRGAGRGSLCFCRAQATEQNRSDQQGDQIPASLIYIRINSSRVKFPLHPTPLPPSLSPSGPSDRLVGAMATEEERSALLDVFLNFCGPENADKGQVRHKCSKQPKMSFDTTSWRTPTTQRFGCLPAVAVFTKHGRGVSWTIGREVFYANSKLGPVTTLLESCVLGCGVVRFVLLCVCVGAPGFIDQPTDCYRLCATPASVCLACAHSWAMCMRGGKSHAEQRNGTV